MLTLHGGPNLADMPADHDHEPQVVLACSQRLHLREYESIPVEPIRILRVEIHELVEKDVSNRRHAHWGTGMPGIGFEGSIDLERPRHNKSAIAAQG